MMNFETYSLLKKFLDNGTFTGIDEIHAERELARSMKKPRKRGN